jgi:uncharacterized protein YifE (UPF0438 family)
MTEEHEDNDLPTILLKKSAPGEAIVKSFPGKLSRAEREQLEKYYAWMVGLAEGFFEPETKAQEHFVNVSKGLITPGSDLESVFTKVQLLKARRANERLKKPTIAAIRGGHRCACSGTNYECTICNGTGWVDT